MDAKEVFDRIAKTILEAHDQYEAEDKVLPILAEIWNDAEGKGEVMGTSNNFYPNPFEATS